VINEKAKVEILSDKTVKITVTGFSILTIVDKPAGKNGNPNPNPAKVVVDDEEDSSVFRSLSLVLAVAYLMM
jgi:hypothetical protein